MIDKEQWLKEEMIKSSNQQKYYNTHPKYKNRRDTIILNKFILLFSIIILIFMGECCAEQISKDINIEWKCPSCGYDNYDEIRYCPICASER